MNQNFDRYLITRSHKIDVLNLLISTLTSTGGLLLLRSPTEHRVKFCTETRQTQTDPTL